jgi:hypothetical protein
MTDKELLEQCVAAFEAVPVARHADKVLRKLGFKWDGSATNRSRFLAGSMAKRIRSHLGQTEDA